MEQTYDAHISNPGPYTTADKNRVIFSANWCMKKIKPDPQSNMVRSTMDITG